MKFDNWTEHNHVMLDLLKKSKNYGEMTPQFIEVLHKIAEVAINDHFPGTPHFDEMLAESMFQFCRMWYRFDASRSNNPLAFFYNCAWSSGLQVLSKERKECTVRELLVLQEEQPDEETEEGRVPD